MDKSDIETIEIDLFVEAMARRHGYDFRHYAKASLRRRVAGMLDALGCTTVAEMLPLILHQPELLPSILSNLSVPVTEMFRDPPVFKALRTEVIPVLATYPRLNIWQAGCATGEEAYSLAILLAETGLLERSQIYATDINDAALAKAEEGIYPAEIITKYAESHRLAGGSLDLQSYFSMAYGFGKIDPAIRAHVSFAHHNLVADGVFCEVNMIVCRNVMIYFDTLLQNRVLDLFGQSLVRNGFLCLGSRENVAFAAAGRQFATVNKILRIYKKTGGEA
ncbi:putative methyltransferase Cher3 [Candidatus Terasakiella magnetica]|nr:putative methyltransferase Cher3 [Candidatus Terasakiella magnetica]